MNYDQNPKVQYLITPRHSLSPPYVTTYKFGAQNANSLSQLMRVDNGAEMRKGPSEWPSLTRVFKNAMVWMVFPRPISSARMVLVPCAQENRNQFRPSIWYSWSSPPVALINSGWASYFILGWKKMKVSFDWWWWLWLWWCWWYLVCLSTILPCQSKPVDSRPWAHKIILACWGSGLIPTLVHTMQWQTTTVPHADNDRDLCSGQQDDNIHTLKDARYSLAQISSSWFISSLFSSVFLFRSLSIASSSYSIWPAGSSDSEKTTNTCVSNGILLRLSWVSGYLSWVGGY